MVNLLPQTAKQQITREYYTRVVGVWMFMVMAALMVLGALLVPIAMLVEVQSSTYKDSYNTAMAGNVSYAQSEATVLEANKLAVELARITAIPPMWDDVARMEGLAGDDISIGTFSLAREQGIVSKMTVTGVATTRAALAAFRGRLDADPRFSNAVLPLSNLAKDKALPFSITVTLDPVPTS